MATCLRHNINTTLFITSKAGGNTQAPAVTATDWQLDPGNGGIHKVLLYYRPHNIGLRMRHKSLFLTYVLAPLCAISNFNYEQVNPRNFPAAMLLHGKLSFRKPVLRSPSGRVRCVVWGGGGGRHQAFWIIRSHQFELAFSSINAFIQSFHISACKTYAYWGKILIFRPLSTR